MVVGPCHESATIRSVQLVGLGPRLALLVVVLSDGAVEKRTLELPTTTSTTSCWPRPAAHLQTDAAGAAAAGRDRPVATRAATHRWTGCSTRRWPPWRRSARAERPTTSSSAGPPGWPVAFDAVETVRSVLSILEQQLVVVTLLRDVLDRGLSVAIGTEHGFEPLASCAVVVAPVSVDGHDAGAVGLLGPTRMNYPQALAAAHVVGERLGERIGGTMGARRGRRADRAEPGSGGAVAGADS